MRRQPFEPFGIRLADGRMLPVRHPEALAVGQRRAVLIQDDDSCIWLEPLRIASLDWPGKINPPDSGGNGSGRRGKRRRP